MTQLSRILILLLILFFVLLAAGCAGGDCGVGRQTVIVSKISQNGTLLWSQVFDTGIMNRIYNIFPLPDGGIVTAGSLSTKRQTCVQEYKARIMRFSDSGYITWDRLFDTSGIGKATAITATNDEGFVTVFNTGEIYKLDQDGNKIWSRNTGKSSDYWSAIETDDGGIVIAGPVFLKLDRNGNILWQRSFPNSSPSEMNSVVELKDNRGFAMEYFIHDPLNWNNHMIVLSLSDPEGNFINSISIPEKSYFIRHFFSEIPGGYMIFLSNEEFNNKTGILRFNTNGTFVNKQVLNASFPVILTKDSGYIYAEIINQNVHVVKMDMNETWEWDSLIPVTDPRFEVSTDMIIQTSDNGYIITYGSWDTVDLR
jgi:hypothetical protein